MDAVGKYANEDELSDGLPSRAFDSIYTRRTSGRLIDKLDRDSLAEPVARDWGTTAFVGPGETAELLDILSRHPGKEGWDNTILDLGCGTGGAASYIAGVTGATVVGIDFSLIAMEKASKRTCRSTSYIASNLLALPIRSEVAHAAYSLDALYLVPDKFNVFDQISRVLIEGAPLVFTAYYRTTQLERGRTVLQAAMKMAGLTVRCCNDRSGAWRSWMRRKHEARLRHAEELIAADGPQIEAELNVSRAMVGYGGSPSFLDQHCRLWVEATKR